MALINCLHCGKQISDRAGICPNCGTTIVQMEDDDFKEQELLCEECGHIILTGMTSCPNCGCPVSAEDTVTEQEPQKVEVTKVSISAESSKKVKKIAIVAISCIVVIACIVVGVNQVRKHQYAQTYYDNMELATYTMLSGAADAENACNLIKSVWYNTIYEVTNLSTNKYTRPNGPFVDDFNEALSNLFADSSFQSQISTIESNQNTVNSLMKELKNPPEEYEDAYGALMALYDEYYSFTNLAVNPSGSLTTFSSNFNAYDSGAMNAYDKMKLYLED